jgi:hypothetical protein
MAAATVFGPRQWYIGCPVPVSIADGSMQLVALAVLSQPPVLGDQLQRAL